MTCFLVLLSTTLLLSTCRAALGFGHGRSIDRLIFFADSFTDQSRSHSIANGTYPAKDYKELMPPLDTAVNGGISWPYYLNLYTSLPYDNYACGGAACSNSLTPPGLPDVSHGQLAWFVQDHVLANATFHTYGIKNFLILSTIPLHLTALYAANDSATIYWPETHNGKAWQVNMYHMENALNGFLEVGIKNLGAHFHDASIEFFNTYKFFEALYTNPKKYYNGSAPISVTGHCHQCPNASNYHYCGVGDCTEAQRDSYMF